MDQADLDFGIYRIMNQKRDEIVRFLDKDLLPQVKEAFKQYKSADKSVLQERTRQARGEQSSGAGMNPDESPKVKELTPADSPIGRGRGGAGERGLLAPVQLLPPLLQRRRFHLAPRGTRKASTPFPTRAKRSNSIGPTPTSITSRAARRSGTTPSRSPAANGSGSISSPHRRSRTTTRQPQGKERRFVLCRDDPLSEENGELFIRFEYRPIEGKEKQDDLNKQAIDAVLKTPGFEQWADELGASSHRPTRSRDRTVLEKHLTQYTARNTFDYFIHKDLGGFLRRELDFYIKNEVMHLDDIEHESAPKVEQYLSQIKVIRSIAHKIIQFLEQLENFQKKLWLKKKFVIETNYCITLDRVPEELYPEIAKNDAQREEWVRLFAIDEIKKDLNGPGYSKPLKVEFLKAIPPCHLTLPSFHGTFNDRLLATIDQ